VTADTQRDPVYAWEGQWRDFNRTTMSLKKVRGIVSEACGKYGVPPPKVVQHFGKALSFSQGDVISFNWDQKNAAIALHESAHRICDFVYGDDMEHHCPEWMSIYLWLLLDHRLAPKQALLMSAKWHGIKWKPIWRSAPKYLKKKRAVHADHG
jgi:hypothetical protein